MLIGELVKRSGFTKDAIRFYEKKGLIYIDGKQRRDNNYKEYPESVVQQLALIKTIKGFGFTLAEIETFLALWRVEGGRCHDNLSAAIDKRVAQLDAQIRHLIQIRNRLNTSLAKCKAGKCDFEQSMILSAR